MLPALSTRRFSLPMPHFTSVLHRPSDNLFDEFLARFNESDGGKWPCGWNAPVAIWDDEKHIYVEVEVPGLGREDVEVIVDKGKLRIRGERKSTDENRNYWYTERTFGRFKRLVMLPDVVDPEMIEAEMRDGVLLVTLTKRPEAQPKKIDIKY